MPTTRSSFVPSESQRGAVRDACIRPTAGAVSRDRSSCGDSLAEGGRCGRARDERRARASLLGRWCLEGSWGTARSRSWMSRGAGQSSRCTSRTTAATSSHAGLRRSARSSRRRLRTSTKSLERLDMVDVAFSAADEAQKSSVQSEVRYAIRSRAAIRDHVCGRPYRRRQPADVPSGVWTLQAARCPTPTPPGAKEYT
jgi:hypothetical protein